MCNYRDFVNSSQDSKSYGELLYKFQCWKWISVLEMNFNAWNVEFWWWKWISVLQCSISGVEIAVLKNLDRGRDNFWNIFKLPQSHLAAIWDIKKLRTCLKNLKKYYGVAEAQTHGQNGPVPLHPTALPLSYESRWEL